MSAPDVDAEIEKLKAFIEPAPVALGAKLRPYTAHTSLLCELMRFPFKRRLKEYTAQFGTDAAAEKNADDLSLYYGLAITLYVHSADPATVDRVAWNPTEAEAAVKAFMEQYTREQIFSAMPAIAQLMSGAQAANDWAVDTDNAGVSPPNSSTPSGSPATSSALRAKRGGRKTSS